MPCGNRGCKCCLAISKKCRVTSTHNNHTYPTQKYTCCSTKNIFIYWSVQNVQKETNIHSPLRIRLNEHKTVKLKLTSHYISTSYRKRTTTSKEMLKSPSYKPPPRKLCKKRNETGFKQWTPHTQNNGLNCQLIY